MTRRNFLKGAGASAAALSLAACGGSDSGDDASAASDGSVKKVLRFAQSNPKLGLDMQQSTNSGSSAIADCIFEAPLRWTEDNELVPCLLTEVPTFEDDGVTLHCELKENIKCHDDSILTANDVKFSFERMFRPETLGKSTYMYDMIVGAKAMLNGEADELEGLTVEDDTHFTIVLESPMSSFVSNLGINYADIFPQAACEAAGSNWGWGMDCVGTGKYKLVSNDDTTEVILEKFADYHGGEPALDEVRFSYIDDNNTKLMSFKNGDVDWCDLDNSLLQQYQEDEVVAPLITLYDTLGVHFVNLNLHNEALADERVREALSISIDRQELVETIVSGAGTPAMGWLAPATPGHDDAAEIAFDPERAKQLLADAGYPDLTLDCVVRASGSYLKYMTAIQSYWAAIGVTLNLNTEDAGVWSSDWAAGNLETTALAWFPLFADGDNHLYTYFFSENSPGKGSFYESAEFDDLVTRARTSQDPEERADLYKQADNLLTRTDFATIPLYWPKNSFVAQPWVKNAKVGNLIYHMFDIDIDTSVEGYNPEV